MKIKQKVKAVKHFILLLHSKIMHDRMTMIAGSLTYTTLLSLVPLMAVAFYLMSAFPVFSDASGQLKSFLFDNLVPTAGDVVQNYIEQFILNLNKMTAIGVCGLIVTSLLVIDSVNSALNYIWRTKRRRSFLFNFVIYWTILTLGPVLIGVSIAVSSYIFSLRVFSDSPVKLNFIVSCLPFLLSCISFWLLYCVVPTDPVPAMDAAIGAVIAAILFELGKKIFSIYITAFPTYQLIYGVLAAIPILFVWIYCSWCIVLLGAEIAATFELYRHRDVFQKEQTLPQDHQEHMPKSEKWVERQL